MKGSIVKTSARVNVGLILLLLVLPISAVYSDSLDNYQYQLDLAAHRLALGIQGVAFLSDNQIARLSNGSTSDVYVAPDIHDYYAYENTFTGQYRYDQAKSAGEDPSKYLSWIANDEQKRAQLVADKKLLLLPYNTQVRIIKYQKDKLDDWVFQQTGETKRLGRYQVQVLDGPCKGLNVWTQDVVDLLPHIGDPAYLGIQPGTKIPTGATLSSIPIVSFDEYALSNYWDSVVKGDDDTASMYLNNNDVFPLHVNTKCVIIKEERLPTNDATYYQVQITSGPRTGKILWTLNVGLNAFPISPTDPADHVPFVGDVAFIGSSKNGDDSVMASADDVQLSLYFQALLSGNRPIVNTILNVQKTVFPVSNETKCTVIAVTTLPTDHVTYYQVRIDDGDKAGQSVWVKDVSLDAVSSKLPAVPTSPGGK